VLGVGIMPLANMTIVAAYSFICLHYYRVIHADIIAISIWWLQSFLSHIISAIITERLTTVISDIEITAQRTA